MTLAQARTQAIDAARVHDYATLLVHVEPGHAANHRVAVAAMLARDLDARLIGLGAETFDSYPASDALTGFGGGEWLALMQEQVNTDLQLAEQAFRRDAAGCELEWRSAQDSPSLAMARAARAADLLIASPPGKAGKARAIDPAELVMTAGRPVLIVPEVSRHLRAKAIVVAWKDTREARRAVADALPFLRRAEEVIVQSVCPESENDSAAFVTGDVAATLKRQGVAARPTVAHGRNEEVVDILQRTAALAGADLIVAGAYGHSRAREWMFGGVTESLLRHPPCPVLLSH